MCYSWYENVEKTAQNDTAQEEPRKTVPEAQAESRVRPEYSRFWTSRVGRRDRATEKAAADRTLEKV